MVTEFPEQFITDSKNSSFKISDFKNAIGKPVRPNLFKAEIAGWQKNIALKRLGRTKFPIEVLKSEILNDAVILCSSYFFA